MYKKTIKGKKLTTATGKTIYKIGNKTFNSREYNNRNAIATLIASSPYLSKKDKDKQIRAVYK